MNYLIINTGSDGNATIVEDILLLDCGLPYKRIEKYASKLKLVLLTHIHGDHFNKATIKKLANKKPTLRFGCCEWLVQPLIECGVNKNNIDVYKLDHKYTYTANLKVKPFKLFHDVPQCGYKIEVNGYKLIYATDTCSLEHITAKNYDYYFVEANYQSEEELHSRAVTKEYEERVKKTHMNKEKTIDWLLENMGDSSKYEFMHAHVHKEDRK